MKHVISLLYVLCTDLTNTKSTNFKTIYLNYHIMYTFFTVFKNLSQSQKSLEEYFNSLLDEYKVFTYIHGITYDTLSEKCFF